MEGAGILSAFALIWLISIATGLGALLTYLLKARHLRYYEKKWPVPPAKVLGEFIVLAIVGGAAVFVCSRGVIFAFSYRDDAELGIFYRPWISYASLTVGLALIVGSIAAVVGAGRSANRDLVDPRPRWRIWGICLAVSAASWLLIPLTHWLDERVEAIRNHDNGGP